LKYFILVRPIEGIIQEFAGLGQRYQVARPVPWQAHFFRDSVTDADAIAGTLQIFRPDLEVQVVAESALNQTEITRYITEVTQFVNIPTS